MPAAAQMHTGYAGAPVRGRTVPPVLDEQARTITLSVDDPVALETAELLTDRLWKAGRTAEAARVGQFLTDRVDPDRRGDHIRP